MSNDVGYRHFFELEATGFMSNRTALFKPEEHLCLVLAWAWLQYSYKGKRSPS